MKRLIFSEITLFSMLSVVLLPKGSWAATPTADQALKLAPVQQSVNYDRPSPEEVAKCKMVAKKIDGRVGWIVESPDGTILRKFVDTNSDGTVDQWSYCKDGLEVYRDIDFNYNGKVDQYRWFNTAGTRWALDTNEDGVIDSWKTISAEEVSAEVVAAIATCDANRFARLLLSPAELKTLGLGNAKAQSVTEKIGKAVTGFRAMAEKQQNVGKDAVWVQFSANRPGVVPAGTDLSTKDLKVYENAAAIVESGGKHEQVQIGTLVQVGDVWRLIDVQTEPSGFFFQAAMTRRTETAPNASNDATQKLLADLDKLDRENGQAASTEEQTKYTKLRAELLEQIADSAKSAEERASWIHQLADMIGAAVQTGTCPDGAERLKSLFEKMKKNESDKGLAAYVKFRQLTAAYVLSMQAPKADFSKIQAEWLKNLEQYISEYSSTPDAAEAMLQLAISQEYAGQEEDAGKWYSRILKEFPQASAAKKAAGAQTRLDSVGKAITFSGKSPLGSPVDLASHRGKVVLIQYWATWCGPAKADMPTLKELLNKYGRSFAIIGVNLDNNVKDLNDYLTENPLPWQQIHEEGGLDSRPANVLGILTVPTMILVDKQGKVVNRNVAIADLEAELKKMVK